MKRTMKKMVSLGLVAAISLTMLVGCGNSKETADNTASDNTANDTSDTSVKEETKTAEKAKIGVLVQDVSGEEALGFRTYYEDYVANQYGVTFTYTDELKDAASEKSAIEKFASQGYQAVISLSSNDRALQIETCEENQIYYAVAAGTLDQEQFEKYKTNEYFLGQVGPSMDTEYEAGVEMGRFFAEKGIKTAAIYGAFIPNPMHVYRVAGVLSGLGLSYDGATEEGEVVGKILLIRAWICLRFLGISRLFLICRAMVIQQQMRSMQQFRQNRKHLFQWEWQQHFYTAVKCCWY